MAVSKKDEAPKAVAADPVKLELVAYARYNRTGMLYERDIVYEVDAEFAKALLQDTTDYGQPVFMRHVPKNTEAQKLAERIARKEQAVKVASPVKSKQTLPVAEGERKTKIEIGSDEEEAELFGNVSDDDGTVEEI